jgi:hypothetical protein
MVFALAKWKSMRLKKDLDNKFLITHIDLRQGFDVEHIQRVILLWEFLSAVNLSVGVQDTISWKFTNDGTYSTVSAYKVQFEGLILSPMERTIWKMWALAKCRFFCLASLASLLDLI